MGFLINLISEDTGELILAPCQAEYYRFKPSTVVAKINEKPEMKLCSPWVVTNSQQKYFYNRKFIFILTVNNPIAGKVCKTFITIQYQVEITFVLTSLKLKIKSDQSWELMYCGYRDQWLISIFFNLQINLILFVIPHGNRIKKWKLWSGDYKYILNTKVSSSSY